MTRVFIRHRSEKGRGREREGASILSKGGAAAEDREPREGEGDAAAAAAHTSRLRDRDGGDEEERSAKARDRDQEQGQEKATTEADGKTAEGEARNEVYYVHSAAATAATTQRFGRYPTVGLEKKSYEVRLRAWNCSCPAFTFAAFSSTPTSSVAPVGRSASVLVDVEDGMEEALGGGEGRMEEGGGEGGTDMGREGEEWGFGGLPSLWAVGEETVPVCKHLLACVVAERCGLLGGFVAERVVSSGEGAGLGAGWGG